MELILPLTPSNFLHNFRKYLESKTLDPFLKKWCKYFFRKMVRPVKDIKLGHDMLRKT
jgi:hypothetical protein